MSLAEKFQITIPAKPEDGHDWTDFKDARDTHGTTVSTDDAKFNQMPAGMNICDQNNALTGPFARGFGGDTDPTGNNDPKSLMAGYSRRAMKSTDDQYSGEHIDLFYSVAKDEEGNEGFTERNNYLDRL